MGKTPKFDNLDRRKVIQAIEKVLDVKLSQVGSRPKEQVDAHGRLYWVLGGYGDWHGIPPEMMERAKSSLDTGSIVIAKRLKEKMRIYIGPIRPFAKGVDMLTKTSKGEFHFDQEIKRGELTIKQLRKAKFELLTEITFTDDEKENERKKSDLIRQIDKLRPEERAALLESLNRA